MNKQEILKEIEELKERLNSLEKMCASLTPPNKRWRAEKYNSYYYISSGGDTPYYCNADIYSSMDKLRYEIGNYFKTKEEVEFEVERLKVIAELKEWATPISEFNWKDDYEKKYVLV